MNRDLREDRVVREQRVRECEHAVVGDQPTDHEDRGDGNEADGGGFLVTGIPVAPTRQEHCPVVRDKPFTVRYWSLPKLVAIMHNFPSSLKAKS